jgi:predicted lipoprotein with Yx(FWY)xxD motif
MTRIARLTGLLVLAALLLAACQPAAEVPATGATATTAPEPTATTAPAATATTETTAAEAEISVSSNEEFGEFLVGNDGMTLYMFTKDEPNKSNCAGDCLVQWPPLLTQGSPVLGEGVDPALVGSAELPDGSMIVTYNGMPLYYWINDKVEGDTTGQAVGEVWWLVSPAGDIIGMDSGAGTEGEGEAAAEGEAEISVSSNEEFGEFLVGNDGMTLYMFTKDEPNKSNCAGDCLVNWPPLLTQGEPVLGEGVDPALVGTAELEDGSMIVTYNGMPLYYWVKDTKAGDTTGQAVGDVWWVVSPEGEIIGMDSGAAGGDEEAAAEGEAELSVATHPELGEILVGKDGMTLYMFSNDEPNKSNCAGNCLVNWPPLVTKGSPVLGEGVNPDLVGTAELENGSLIVTYNGMPLYYWKDDKAAGDATGQGVGDVWWVVSPEGEIIGMSAIDTPVMGDYNY